MDFESVCQKIQKLSDKIRFAGVINDKGRLVAGGMKSGQQSLEDSKRDEMLFMELALRVRMRGEFNEDFGAVKFSLSYREKVIVMSFPIGNNILLVSSDRDIEFSKIPFDILSVIDESS